MWYERTSGAVFGVLCAVFGMDRSSGEARERFRAAYDPAVTVPRFPINFNVCFYSLSRRHEPGAEGVIRINLPGRGGAAGTEETHQLLSVMLRLSFYGISAIEDAEVCRVGLLDGTAVRIFRESGVYPVKMPAAPLFLPERDGPDWRRRCDLNARLYVAEKTEKTYPALLSPPEVILH